MNNKYDYNYNDPKPNFVTCTTRCPVCGKEWKITLPAKVFDKGVAHYYYEGALAQVAFPTLDPEQREFFVSGTCDKCWKEMFGMEE